MAAHVLCAWCGARWPHGVRPDAARLAAAMRPGPVHAVDARTGGLLLDDYTFRTAATRHALRFHPVAGDVVPGHTGVPAEGTLRPMIARPATNVALAMLSRSDDRRALALVDAFSGVFGAVVAVVDPQQRDTVSEGLAAQGVTVVERPLRSFDASRNAAQRLAALPWVLHVDTDETLSAPLVRSLHALVSLANEAHIDAIGFARRNYVDGVLSDLYPDVQYRLVRRTVRFEGAVHERPDACRHWPRTMIALTGPIAHHLTGERVRARARRYDAMGQDAARAAEAEALLRPFAP